MIEINNVLKKDMSEEKTHKVNAFSVDITHSRHICVSKYVYQHTFTFYNVNIYSMLIYTYMYRKAAEGNPDDVFF